MNETVSIRHDGKRGFLSVKPDDTLLAMMTFRFDGKTKMIIEHTEVTPGYNGKGYGKSLVAKAVEFARENKLSIVPLCPYARKVINETPEYSDVL
jgi:predicted GNAT family acetyltransferase